MPSLVTGQEQVGKTAAAQAAMARNVAPPLAPILASLAILALVPVAIGSLWGLTHVVNLAGALDLAATGVACGLLGWVVQARANSYNRMAAYFGSTVALPVLLGLIAAHWPSPSPLDLAVPLFGMLMGVLGNVQGLKDWPWPPRSALAHQGA